MDIGPFIRDRVIPHGMSVTEAARRLGVARSTLSRLLNGHASLSSEMSLRLERAFGANHQKLLGFQSEAHRERRSNHEGSVAVHAYAPPFLNITALKISNWATGNIEAQHQLPVLLRRLIHSTGSILRHVDFPGGNNAQRPGWDGWVEAGAPTPWIPAGRSGWELSTEQRPAAKANHDYRARLAIAAVDRAQCTFVFATTQNWRGKAEWAKSKEALGDFKAVRAFDASDLEQWLEASIPGQVWLAEKLEIPTDGIESLAHSWDRWAEASEPRMTTKIFEKSLDAHRSTFNNWLDKRPGERPLAVAADSKDEALAFLACLFADRGGPANHGDQAAVFRSAQTLRNLASTPSPFIPIAYDEDAEHELPAIYRQLRCIVIRPRNAVDREPDIALDLLGRKAFEAALADMGVPQDEFDRLSRESGRSPTILRRRLSQIDAIRKPRWAEDLNTARSLILFAMVGAWHSESEADKKAIADLASVCYPRVEEVITDLLDIEDCPVWSVGKYRGVVSKIDTLFAISGLITGPILEDFFALAERVLSEADPSLDLPEDQRWAAAIYDKVRNHSTTLRNGICETLVLLSVHGNALFQNRLGLDVESSVSGLITDLLEPLTVEKLLSHEDDLPNYAEAAPAEFLRLVEIDLQQPNPELLRILKPADSGIFSNCPRTGLLWALECVAWNPRFLARVTKILAELSKTEINDNWVNKPIASLDSIYRSWMPQTAAPLSVRIKGLKMLVSRFPDIGWQICMQQFGTGTQTGMYTYRPRWRADASGAGHVTSNQERSAFARNALDVALAWQQPYDSYKLGDLVDRLNAVLPADEMAIWETIDTWAQTDVNESDKAQLRGRIRRLALGRGSRALADQTRNRALDAYKKLEPRDVVAHHSWLFKQHWVDVPETEWITDSGSETDERQFDIDKRDEWVFEARSRAMAEIWDDRGFNGIAELINDSEAPEVIGRIAAQTISGIESSTAILLSSLTSESESRINFDTFMHGFIWFVEASRRSDLLTDLAARTSSEQFLRLLCCAPCSDETWRIVDRQPVDFRDRYWREVNPRWIQLGEAEINEFIDRFLYVGRPRAAFRAVQWNWKNVETSRFKRLMMKVASTNEEAGVGFGFDSFDIAHAVKALSVRADITQIDMAQLELAYIDALDDDEYGIPNLEIQIAEWPILFVQALALCYKRSDDSQDPVDWHTQNPDQRVAAATAALRLLDGLRRIPGTGTDGSIDVTRLQNWVADVRRLCTEHGRAEQGDLRIGQLLSKAPADTDGVWPCRSVCEVMETVHSEHIAYGFHLGVRNARGFHMRGEGGYQEREIAAKYQMLARELDFEYPYVSSVLEGIASSYERNAVEEDSAASVRRRLIL